MADEEVKVREENLGVPIISPSIPAGEQTVWADVSSLLQSACHGTYFHSLFLSICPSFFTVFI